jgi:hypothetical protein
LRTEDLPTVHGTHSARMGWARVTGHATIPARA